MKCLEQCLAQLQGGHFGGCGQGPMNWGQGDEDTVWGQRFATDLPWRCGRSSLTLDSESGDSPGSRRLGDSGNGV